MNPKSIPWLLAVLVLLGLVTFFWDHPLTTGPAATKPASGRLEARVLEISQQDILRVRVKRDYWNTYTLGRAPGASWKLIDPSTEDASEAAVEKLLATIEFLPVLSTLNLSADDSERHREYGLWTPSLELAVSTGSATHVLTFGKPTPDGKGVYCSLAGRDKVYVTTPEAAQVLSQDLSVYRRVKGAVAP